MSAKQILVTSSEKVILWQTWRNFRKSCERRVGFSFRWPDDPLIFKRGKWRQLSPVGCENSYFRPQGTKLMLFQWSLSMRNMTAMVPFSRANIGFFSFLLSCLLCFGFVPCTPNKNPFLDEEDCCVSVHTCSTGIWMERRRFPAWWACLCALWNDCCLYGYCLQKRERKMLHFRCCSTEVLTFYGNFSFRKLSRKMKF